MVQYKHNINECKKQAVVVTLICSIQFNRSHVTTTYFEEAPSEDGRCSCQTNRAQLTARRSSL